MSASSSADTLFTQAEAAKILGVTDRSIRKYIAEGHLRAHRMRGSRLVRIRQSDIDAFLVPVAVIGDAS